MPKSDHSTKKKPGRAKWYARRNVHRLHERNKEANDLAFLLDFKRCQAKGKE